jgi:hypothetical protein
MVEVTPYLRRDMPKKDIFVYPSGVLTGNPFTDIATAFAWIVQADQKLYPGMPGDLGGAQWHDSVVSWTDKFTPELVTSPTRLIFIDPSDDLALREAWNDWDLSLNYDNAPYPIDLPRFDASVAVDITISLDFVLGHYQKLQGIADYLRRSLPQAKQRRDVAKQLYEIEPAIERVGTTLLRFLNTYVSELWKLAIMQGEITDPPNPYAPKPTTNNPAGIARLNG